MGRQLPEGVALLPTAAARPVRQPQYPCRRLLERAGEATGVIRRLPPIVRRTPARTAAEAEARAARLRLYEAGRIDRSAPVVLLDAVFAVLTEDQRLAAIARLQLCNFEADDPATAAALDWAWSTNAALRNSQKGT